jgi:hypothetical protein
MVQPWVHAHAATKWHSRTIFMRNGLKREIGMINSILEQLVVQWGGGSLGDLCFARRMLRVVADKGQLPQYQPQAFPVSLWQLGELRWVALAGEVTVGYVDRLRAELSGGEKRGHVWVSGYTNQVQCYIPTQTVMDEGGYEGGDNMISSAHPARYADGLEEVLVAAVNSLAAFTNRAAAL